MRAVDGLASTDDWGFRVMRGARRARSGRQRRARFALGGAVLSAALVAGVWAGPSQAQTDPDPTPGTNFSMAGIADASQMQAFALDTNITASQFQFCNNVNGLGAELYLFGTSDTGAIVQHATVTPFVVPIHIGVLDVTNPDPDNFLDNQRFLTLGVAKGTPIEFGQSGSATVEYGGVYFGPSVGLASWTYSADITCTDSVVMPIIGPLINGDAPVTTAPPATTTTAPPATTTTTTTEPPAP